MKYALALLTVAGIAAGANAQSSNLVFSASVNGGAFGTGVVQAAPGDSVVIEARVSASAGSTFLGLLGGNFQVTASNWADALAPFTPQAGRTGVAMNEFGRVAPYGNVATSANPTSAVAAGTLTISGSNSGRIAISQPPPSINTAFVGGSSNLLIFRFGFTLNASTAIRDVVVNATNPNGTFRWSTGGSAGSIAASTFEGVTLRIPTPGALALLGLGGLAAARRRR
jgi:hypothetical protein